MNKQAILGAVLLAAAVPVLAATKIAQSGFYIGANGGSGQIYSPYSYMNNATGSYNYGAFAWGINAGYQHALNRNFSLGVELGYNDNGQSKYNASGGTNDTGSLQISSQDWSLLGTADLLWPCGINVFAKAGLAYVMQTANLEAPVTFPNATLTSGFNDTNYGVQPLVAWGIGYEITQNLNVYGMGSYLFADHGNNWKDVYVNNDVDTNLFSVLTWQLGVNYRFGS